MMAPVNGVWRWCSRGHRQGALAFERGQSTWILKGGGREEERMGKESKQVREAEGSPLG